MRVDRKQIENLAEGLKTTDAQELDLVIEDGKLRLYEVILEPKLKAVPITPQGIAQRKRRRS